MGEVAIPILITALVAGLIVFVMSGGSFDFTGLWKARCGKRTRLSGQRPLDMLNCRVRLAKPEENSLAFVVEICGTICADTEADHASGRISIIDVTDGGREAKPIHSRVKKWQTEGSATFCYRTELGKLGNKLIALQDWTAIGQIQTDWLRFSRKGKRTLQFDVSILSHCSGEELAKSKCILNFDNRSFGYIDLRENSQRVKTLAVTLAFAVGAADGKLCDRKVDVIKKWAKANVQFFRGGKRLQRKFEKALNKTVVYFRKVNQFDTHRICKAIVDVAPVADRYDILELCLYVAQADGVASAQELAVLKNLADWLEVDRNRVREMIGKILPANVHEVKDAEVVLGVTPDMSKEETREHLNKEYRKWHARVTNFNSEVQAQAEDMLKLIAQVRSEYAS